MAKKANISAGISLDGEKEFKQAISGINTDMKVLASEMKKVTSEFVGNASSVEALTAKDKILASEVDKQKEKIDELQKALKNSSEQYGENDKKTSNWKISLNEAQTKLNGLNNEVDQNKKALQQAKNPTEQIAQEIKTYGNNAEVAGEKSLKMGDIIKANVISSAIINGVKQLASAMKDVAMQSLNTADEIATLSGQTGLSTDQIQVWSYVGKALDVDLETITGSVSKLTRAMTAAKDGTGAQAEAFKSLKVNVTNSDGSLRDSKVVMLEAITALGKMKNETDRDSTALVLFGKSALELNPLIKAGSATIKDLTDAAYKNGAVMSDSTVEGLDKFKDSTEMLNQEIQSLTGEVLVDLMPTFQDILQWVRDNKDDIKKFATDSLDAIKDSIKFITDNANWLIPVLGTLLIAFLAFKAIEGINVALGIFNVLMAANPFGIVIIGCAALVTGLILLVKNWDKVSDAIDRALGKKRDFNQEGNTGVSGGGAGGKSGGGAWASGAIFTKPRLFPSGDLVGEAGAEGVLPISQLPSLLGLDRMSSAEDTARAVHDELKNFAIYLDGDRVGSFVDTRIVKGAM